jgi:hypothetical protein
LHHGLLGLAGRRRTFEFRQAAGQLLKRVPLDRRLRLLGVRVSSLVKSDIQSD